MAKIFRIAIYTRTIHALNALYQYNSNVAQIIRSYSQKHINKENAINDFSISYEIPSIVEASVLKHPEVHGGSGFGVATVQDLGFDLGFEPTLGGDVW